MGGHDRIEEQGVEGNGPKLRPVVKQGCWVEVAPGQTRKGSHRNSSDLTRVSGGCLLSLSMCRTGVQHFQKISPSSLCNNIFFSKSLVFIYKGR